MSNIIDKIRVSGVTYDIQGGGGSVTIDPSLDSGSTNAVANSAITEAVEASGLTVGGFQIGFGIYDSKHLDKITMYCKTQNSGSRTERFYCTDGDNTVQCSIQVNYVNYAITSVGTYSGNITPTLSNGEITIQFTDGYYFGNLSTSNDALGYKYSVTYSGGTASDVIEGSVAEAMTDTNSRIPSDIVTNVSTSIRTSSKTFVTRVATNNGTTETTIPLYDDKSISYDTNSGGLYVQLKGKTTGYKILNTGGGNYCTIPTASLTYDYAFDRIALLFNTACTRTNTSTVEVYTINSGMTVYKDVYTYSLTSDTMSYVSGDSMTQYGRVSGIGYWISPKDEYASTIKIQYIRETSCSICGIDNTNPNNYIITIVDGRNDVYNAQEVIDDLYDKIDDKQDPLSAGTNITISGNVISAQLEGGTVSRGDVEDMISEATSGLQETLVAGSGITISGNVISATGGGGGGTIDPSLDSGSTNAVANSAITEAVVASGLTVGGSPIVYGKDYQLDNIRITKAANTGNGNRTFYFYATSGESYTRFAIRYHYTGLNIDSYTATTGGDYYTCQIVDGGVNVTFVQGWYFLSLYSNILNENVTYSTSYSGGTASDVIEGSVANAITNVNNRIPPTIVTNVSTNIGNGGLNVIVNNSNGGSSSTPTALYDKKTIQHDNDGLHVSFTGQEKHMVLLNDTTKSNNYCSIPNNEETSYPYGYDKLVVTFNSGYTDYEYINEVDVKLTARTENNVSAVTTYVYNFTANTLTYSSGDIQPTVTQDGYVYTFLLGDDTYRITSFQAGNCSIASTSAIGTQYYIVSRVEGRTYAYNGQDVIDDIYDSISGKADTSAVYTKSEVDNAITAATDDMATQTWVGQQGYITGVDLSNYATTAYVDGAVSGKVETSAITSAVTSASTDNEIPTAKAVYDAIPTSTSAVTSGSTSVITSGGVYQQMGGLKMVKLTQQEYDNLQNKDNNTLYVIT